MWTVPDTLKELEEAGEGNIVRELVNSFRHDTASRLHRLRDALARLDAVSLQAEAHSVCGAARQMGAPELADACWCIETAAPEGDWSALAGHLRQAEAYFDEACTAMFVYLQRYRGGE